eukprot:jgi/Mesen1/1491/ME000132S00426
MRRQRGPHVCARCDQSVAPPTRQRKVKHMTQVHGERYCCQLPWKGSQSARRKERPERSCASLAQQDDNQSGEAGTCSTLELQQSPPGRMHSPSPPAVDFPGEGPPVPACETQPPLPAVGSNSSEEEEDPQASTEEGAQDPAEYSGPLSSGKEAPNGSSVDGDAVSLRDLKGGLSIVPHAGQSQSPEGPIAHGRSLRLFCALDHQYSDFMAIAHEMGELLRETVESEFEALGRAVKRESENLHSRADAELTGAKRDFKRLESMVMLLSQKMEAVKRHVKSLRTASPTVLSPTSEAEVTLALAVRVV